MPGTVQEYGFLTKLREYLGECLATGIKAC